MKLIELINRPVTPMPWSEGDNIPWNEPGFSERMLREHFRQDHDAASRRTGIIEQHVAWIHGSVLQGHQTHILDLGCGPGLYSSRLARLGHTCTGIDFSPASIRYAIEEATRDDLACTYLHGDIRKTPYGSGYGMVMLIYGEFNVFRPEDARAILTTAHKALIPGGCLLLETSTVDDVRKIGGGGRGWYSSHAGLFSAEAHIVLTESSWDEISNTATTRHYIVDGATGDITAYASTYQAYSNDALVELLDECGFDEVTFYPSLLGVADASQQDFIATVAHKRER